jgi:hypothetical protein
MQSPVLDDVITAMLTQIAGEEGKGIHGFSVVPVHTFWVVWSQSQKCLAADVEKVEIKLD